MVKTFGPLFSLGASGTIGSTITYARLKDVNIAKRKVRRSNSSSPDQDGRRELYKACCSIWKNLDSADKSSWLTYGPDDESSAFNRFISYCLLNWGNGGIFTNPVLPNWPKCPIGPSRSYPYSSEPWAPTMNGPIASKVDGKLQISVSIDNFGDWWHLLGLSLGPLSTIPNPWSIVKIWYRPKTDVLYSHFFLPKVEGNLILNCFVVDYLGFTFYDEIIPVSFP